MRWLVASLAVYRFRFNARTVVPSAASRRDRIWRCGLTPLLFYSRPLTGTSNSFSAPRILPALSSHSNNTYTSADNTSDTCNYRRRPIIFCKQQRYCSSSADSDRKFNYRARLIVGYETNNSCPGSQMINADLYTDDFSIKQGVR